VCQPFDLFGQTHGIEGLQGLDDTGMQRPPPLVQQAAVGHLMGESVFEGILVVGKESCLIQAFGRLQVRAAQAQRFLRHVSDGL
jgi:hypothetical protein